MFLLSYKYLDENNGDGWDISTINFRKNNLFVGVSGSGKSLMLNSFLNISSFILKNEFRNGIWEITFSTKNKAYKWIVHCSLDNDEQIILSERLSILVNGVEQHVIFDRKKESFEFEGKGLPKLPKNISGISLLQEEDSVAPVYEGFGKILRRNFFGSDLADACSISNVPPELLDKKTYLKLSGFTSIIAISPRLYLLNLHNKKLFEYVVEEFKSIFPSIEGMTFTDGSNMVADRGSYPILSIKEKLINKPVMLHELSSGMQKVLLIITDIITLANNSIYIIDEYENSLGINAINFLPDFIISHGKESQFITTSHHPYLINNIPISDWQVFSRHGSTVSVKSGEELIGQYSRSKQDAFIQLMNDPAYTGS